MLFDSEGLAGKRGGRRSVKVAKGKKGYQTERNLLAAWRWALVWAIGKLTWLVLGGDPAARSHRVEQFTAL